MDLSRYLDTTKDYSLPEYDEAVNPVDEFKFALKKINYPVPDDVMPDGSIHRWDDPSRDKKDKPYWYILELHNGNILAGRYGSWIDGESHSFFSTGFYGLDQIDCLALDESIRRKAGIESEERKEYQKVVANDVRIILSMCTKLDNHEYLVNKQVKEYGLAKNGDGDIVIPMVDGYGKLWNIQRINKSGKKMFYRGAKVNGCRFDINGNNDVTLLVEGYATGASCHEASGYTTRVAFNAVNMMNIAKELKGQRFIIIADNDKSKTGENKAKECVNAYGGKYILIPEVGMDANDYAKKYGIEKLRALIMNESGDNPLDNIDSMSMTTSYVDSLGKEQWLFPNLIQGRSVTSIVAEGGGGKTTIFFNYIAPYIAENFKDKIVRYIDCDSLTNDHPKMRYSKTYTDYDNFLLIHPESHGKDEQFILSELDKLVSARESLNHCIFIFDTLKKFTDLFSKKDVKAFYKRAKALTGCGATVVFLSHANKMRSQDGQLIPEGVGDVRNDVDNLIFFDVAYHGPDGDIIVTTIVDRGKNAMVKVRGLYKPISFHIKTDRSVELLDEVVPFKTVNGNEIKSGSKKESRVSDQDISAWIRQTLIDFGRLTNQSDIMSNAKDAGLPDTRTKAMLRNSSVPETKANDGDIFYRRGGYNNSEVLYSIFGSPWTK